MMTLKPFLLVGLILMYGVAFAQAPSHDPTPMQLDGGRYWIFTTGEGVWHMSSSDNEFINWRSEGEIFARGSWPSWINDYVPGFEGHFWAPGIIYMNGKWHVYYSCSTFGSQTSAIGLVTTTSLSSPNWQDQGMVVYSNSSRQSELGFNVNAIDADVFRDRVGRVWMLYGSYWDGIVVTELDTATGKPIDPTNLSHVANGNPEAGAIISHGDYYYAFFDRGACCRGINSYYHILMGRSKNPNGPFYDRDSVRTDQGGGSLFLHSDGRFVGPGHFGFNHDKLTYHYYDGLANGSPRLKVGDMEWEEDGWPKAIYTRNGAMTDGIYALKNRNSQKMLQVAQDDVVDGTNVVQGTETGDTTQHWRFTYIGDGYYEISPVLNPGMSLEIADCSTTNGANAQVGDSTGADCQLWYVARMGSYYRIMSKNSRKALEIENAYTNDGANAKQWPFNEHATQQWSVSAPRKVEVPVTLNLDSGEGVAIYPNPSNGYFTIQLPHTIEKAHLSVYQFDGKLILNKDIYQNTLTINEDFKPGLYLVKLQFGDQSVVNKLVIR